MTKNKKWYDYLWIASALYLMLGFVNIVFAWLGLLCFGIPLLIAIFGGSKAYCDKYCGRGQLFHVLGKNCKLSANRKTPNFLKSNWFRYGFMVFFLSMFMLMIFNTYLVAAGAKTLSETVTLLWTFKLPWHWANTSHIDGWVAQFSFGFYGVMLTATTLGVISMILFKPRSWCVYCPMGTMTQLICKLKNKNKIVQE